MASTGTSDAFNMGLRFLARVCPNVEEYYQSVVGEGQAILQIFGQAESDSEKCVSADRVHQLVQKVMTPISNGRTFFTFGTLFAAYTFFYMPIISYIPLATTALFFTTVIGVGLTVDCNHTYNEFVQLDRWLIERLETDVSWGELFPKIKGCFYLIQDNTWFFSRNKLFGQELSAFPHFLDQVKKSYGSESRGAVDSSMISGGKLLHLIGLARNASQTILTRAGEESERQ